MIPEGYVVVKTMGGAKILIPEHPEIPDIPEIKDNSLREDIDILKNKIEFLENRLMGGWCGMWI